jgi:glucokinase
MSTTSWGAVEARANGNGASAAVPPASAATPTSPVGSVPRGRRGAARSIVAGLDVGGTKTLAVATGAAGAIVATVRRPTESGSRERVLRSITEALVELGDAVGCGVNGFAAVGVGIPGLVDVNAGTVRHAVNLGLGSSPLQLAKKLGASAEAPVVVDNDVNVAAIGAAAALGCRDLAYLSVGTGIAAGLLLDGRLRRGSRGAAGEIGHLPVDPEGPTCDCGQRGCLEAVASGPALARRWPPGHGAPSVSAALLDAAAAGDGSAIAVRDQVAGHLADAVALLAQTVDPDLVVLGGGVAEAGDPLLDAVVHALNERADRSPVVAALELTGRVALVPDGVPVGALGAALAARRQVMTRLDAVAGPAFEVREAM